MKKLLVMLAVLAVCSVGFAEHVYKVEKTGDDLYKISYAEEMLNTKGKKVLIETKSIERSEQQIRDSYDKAVETQGKLNQLVDDLQFVIKKLKRVKD